MTTIIQPPIAQQPKTTGSFFSLPGEIRNKCYAIVLSGSAPGNIRVHSKEERATRDRVYAIRENRQSPPRAMLPSGNALLHTCRQAYHEGARFYYEDNKFVVFSDPICNAFAKSLSPIHVASIRRLNVNILALRRPIMTDFHCRRSWTPEPDENGHRKRISLHDTDFMSSKQLNRLAIFQGLRILTFGGRFGSHGSGFPRDVFGRPGPSITLLHKLIVLAQTLEHLELIKMISYIHKSHPRRGNVFSWRTLPENALGTEDWEYFLRFKGKYVLRGLSQALPPKDAYIEQRNGKHVFIVETLKHKSRGRPYVREIVDVDPEEYLSG